MPFPVISINLKLWNISCWKEWVDFLKNYHLQKLMNPPFCMPLSSLDKKSPTFRKIVLDIKFWTFRSITCPMRKVLDSLRLATYLRICSPKPNFLVLPGFNIRFTTMYRLYNLGRDEIRGDDRPKRRVTEIDKCPHSEPKSILLSTFLRARRYRNTAFGW